jgi:hypothetical protein
VTEPREIQGSQWPDAPAIPPLAPAPGGGHRRVDVPGDGTFDLWDLPTDEASLLDLIEQVFTTWWPSIRFGVLVPGAAWEVRAPGPPRSITLFDGYATIEFGPWHVHLCIGPFVGDPDDPLPAPLAAARRTDRAELGRRVGRDGAPTSWFVRLTTGAGDQQMTVLRPNPFLDDDQRILPTPDWDRLAAWDALRHRFVGLGPDDVDRSGRGFAHE